VIVMAGTISEEGADRASFTNANGRTLDASAGTGSSLDWYVHCPRQIGAVDGSRTCSNPANVKNGLDHRSGQNPLI